MQSPTPADFLLTGTGELVTVEGDLGEGPLGVIRGGALAALAGRIVWIGRTAEACRAVALRDGGVELDARGRVVLPGFVDSHTHLVFAGSREKEFARRIAGASYQEIATAGGGILATVQATRDATADELVALALRRLDLALQHGTTTIEAKSGYGLTTADEVKMLEAIRVLRTHPVEVHATFCGAHEVPPEFKGNTDGYVDLVVDEMLPEVNFFYIQGGGNANAEAAIRAAQRVGIRLVLARAFYDWSGAPPEYRGRPPRRSSAAACSWPATPATRRSPCSRLPTACTPPRRR